MIGQTQLLKQIAEQIHKDRFPRFIMLVGEEGSGKHLVSRFISDCYGALRIETGCKVDMIRHLIEQAYKITETTVFVIEDVDNISTAAANALLKVTEEPPNNAHFVLLCENEQNLLQTIRSRGVVYWMDQYTYDELSEYMDDFYDGDEKEFILDIATTPGEAKKLADMDISGFKDFINLVVDNIDSVSGSNALKIGNSIAVKENDTGYDLRLFWKAFSSICADRMVHNSGSDHCLRYANVVAVTGDALTQLNIRGINKSMLFDTWVLRIREVLL